MAKNESCLNSIRNLLVDSKISSIDEILEVSEADTRMTAFRILKTLDYLSSYSHRGSFYTLREVADFDENGLWSLGDVRFSRDGSLINTLVRLVTESSAGCSVSELDDLLGVETKHGALQAFKRKLMTREKIGGRFVYLSVDAKSRRMQKLEREERNADAALGIGLDATLLPDEAKVAIILFFSLLDERQRRLYAGLEAAKLGHGGDRKIAEFFDLDPHTVAKGRRELLGGAISERIREPGGGNRPIEKKRPRSSI